MLGGFGIPESRVAAMTLPELDGFMMQAALLRRAAQSLIPMPFFQAASAPNTDPSGGKSQTYISKRKPKP